MTKYHNRKVVVDGIKFDSKKEAKRYKELLEEEKKHTISDLKMQESFVLVPSQRIDGKVVERAVTYKADFSYIRDGIQVVEDCKSPITKTPQYIIKRKLMLYLKGIKVKEI